ncbi:Uncharacterised protein [Chlamydia trachomatis]|nr:Uncharacterised protein [Chlamydia trachomatis]
MDFVYWVVCSYELRIKVKLGYSLLFTIPYSNRLLLTRGL